jgi:hypothetical protein
MLKRNKDLAARAEDPNIRAVHEAWVSFYMRLADMPARPSPLFSVTPKSVVQTKAAAGRVWRRARSRSVSLVLEIALINQGMNYLYYGSWRWADTLSDKRITLFWPSLCVTVGRYRRWCWTRRQRQWRQAIVSGSGSIGALQPVSHAHALAAWSKLLPPADPAWPGDQCW